MGNELPPLEECPVYHDLRLCLELLEDSDDENIKKLHRKIQETWGYDLDVNDNVPGSYHLLPFDMSNKDDKELYYEDAMMATDFALDEIEMDLGKIYEFVELKNVVDSSFHVLFLTFTAKGACEVCTCEDCADDEVCADDEACADDSELVTFQAMVYVSFCSPHNHKVLHWRIKETSS